MRFLSALITCLFTATMLLSPAVNPCFCKLDKSSCAYSKHTQPKCAGHSCCSKSAGRGAAKTEESCDKNKTLHCLNCTKSFYALNQGITRGAELNDYTDFDYPGGIYSDDLAINEASRIIKKPPGKINLHSHIQSTIIRC